MSTKNNTKSRLAIAWHSILQDATSIGNSFVSNRLLTKAVSSLQTFEGPRHECVKITGKRGLDVGVESHGNARIFFKSLLKAD